MDLDAHPYRCFIAVAEQLSFSRAAAQLHISQPALSAQIRELERRLGFPLFTRTSRHVELSSEGRLFLPNARRIVSETAIINRAAREIRTNELRLGAAMHTELIQERIQLCEDFLRAFPHIPIQILNDHHARLMTGLARHEIDIVLSIEPLTGPDRIRARTANAEEGNSTWEHHVLSEKPIELAIPNEHPLAELTAIPLQALQGLPIVAPTRFHGVALSEAITYRLAELGAELIRPPEGHAIAVERHGRLTRTVAIALSWFNRYLDEPASEAPGTVRRPVIGLELSTAVTLTRGPGDQRPAAECFWDEARRRGARGPGL